MSDTTVSLPEKKPPGKKARRWLRWLGWAVIALVVALIALYFIATSSAFLMSVVLPRAGAALNANITVSDASLHPFSSLDLRDLKVAARGQPPVLTAAEVRIHYHLFDLLGGKVDVNDITLASPTVELIQNPDGSSNLDPIMRALQASSSTKAKPVSPSSPSSAKPPQIDIGQLALNNATILQIKKYADGRSDVTCVTNINVTLAGLENGQTAKLDLAADLQINDQSTNAPGQLAAALKGSFNCALTPALQPASAGGSASFNVSQSGGVFSDFASFSSAFDCDVTSSEVKKLALSFQRAGEPLGELTVTGPFDGSKMEGKLNVELTGVDHRLFNLFGQKSGLDFGAATVDSTNQIDLANDGSLITAAGQFRLAKMQVTRAGQTTPTLNLTAAYDVALDRTAQSATLRTLSLTGTQNDAPLLTAHLTSPMSLTWGNGANDNGNAALALAVTNLNLADWEPFLGQAVTGGNVGLNLNVVSQQGGKQISFDLHSDLAGLALHLGANPAPPVDVTLAAHGQATNLKQIILNDYQLQMNLQNQTALTVSGSGNYDLTTGQAAAQIQLQSTLPRLLQLMPQPGINISAGDLALNAQVAQKEKTQTVTGDLTLTNFDGQLGKNNFSDYSTAIHLDLARTTSQIQINHVTGSFNQNGNPGGYFDLSGSCQPAQPAADVSLKLSSLNENALRPFLEPLLAGKQLTSVSVNGDVSAQYDSQAGSSVKAGVEVTNLVVNDPQHQFPPTALAAGLQVDASVNHQSADVRQLQLALTPTALGANQLNLTGQVDFSKTNAIQGNLKLAADSLDLTSYYDLFFGGTNVAAKAAAVASQPAPKPSEEPAPVNLPLQNFSLDADIGRLYLQEIAITNFNATVKIDGGHVVLKPFALTLNGAPVNASADLDLSVPGYKYNVAFNATNVPLAPLVDTFEPSRAGQIGGDLTADEQVTGAGLTGASLQKNLAGQFSLNATNLNLSVINVQSRLLKTVVNVVATIPQLLSNPETAIVSLFGRVTGKSGLMNELQQAPIEVITTQITAGDGQVHLQSAVVQSAAFEADASGAITLNSVLTNSTINIPVTVSLSQAIAGELNVGATGTATNADYSALPQFLTLTGTVGDPKANINKMALAGIAGHSLGSGLRHSGTNATSTVGNFFNRIFHFGK